MIQPVSYIYSLSVQVSNTVPKCCYHFWKTIFYIKSLLSILHTMHILIWRSCIYWLCVCVSVHMGRVCTLMYVWLVSFYEWYGSKSTKLESRFYSLLLPVQDTEISLALKTQQLMNPKLPRCKRELFTASVCFSL